MWAHALSLWSSLRCSREDGEGQETKPQNLQSLGQELTKNKVFNCKGR